MVAYGAEGAWAALGDPTRHAIVAALAERPRAVTELAAELPVSRPTGRIPLRRRAGVRHDQRRRRGDLEGAGSRKDEAGRGVSYRGAVYFQNASGKLARLNGMAAVYEHESGANDEVSTKYWEWK